jgi:hypothetical protein
MRFDIINAATSNMYLDASNNPLTGFIWAHTYAFRVRGETDSVSLTITAGRPIDLATAPTDVVVCATDDISTAPTNIGAGLSGPPSGCQTPQVSNKIRLYWGHPVNVGKNDNEPVPYLAWEIEWSTDPTFNPMFDTGIRRESCIAHAPNEVHGLSTADGHVCNFHYHSAQIPITRSPVVGATYYVRVALRTQVGVGHWSIPTATAPIPYVGACRAGG